MVWDVFDLNLLYCVSIEKILRFLELGFDCYCEWWCLFGFTQATLGLGTAEERIILQCNIGNKSPVVKGNIVYFGYLCRLIWVLFFKVCSSCSKFMWIKREINIIFWSCFSYIFVQFFVLGGERYKIWEKNTYLPLILTEVGYRKQTDHTSGGLNDTFQTTGRQSDFRINHRWV